MLLHLVAGEVDRSSYEMHIDYWESLTNRIHGSFSSRSTMRVLVDP